MNYFLIHKLGTHAERAEHVAEFIAKVESVDQSSWCCLHMEDSEYSIVLARFKSHTAESDLTKSGACVWPHLADHDERITDNHHLGKIPERLGIKSGDSVYAAAKKLAAEWPILHPRLY